MSAEARAHVLGQLLGAILLGVILGAVVLAGFDRVSRDADARWQKSAPVRDDTHSIAQANGRAIADMRREFAEADMCRRKAP